MSDSHSVSQEFPTQPSQSGRFEMKFPQSSRMAPAILALTAFAASHCNVGKYPPDEHNKVARPFIYDSAAADPYGVLLAGRTSVKTGQVFNLGEESLEGGSETQLLSALPDYSAESRASQESMFDGIVGPFTAPPDSEIGFEVSRLPPELWAENGTLLNRAQRMLYRLRDEKPHETNPLRYIENLGLLLYATLELDYAPANDRFAAIVQRLSKTPDYLQTAQSNLRSSSELNIAAAREASRGVINLIRNDIAAKMPSSMESGFDEAAGRAVAAIESFDSFLDGLPSGDDWRAGAALVHRKLELDSGRRLPQMQTVLDNFESDFEDAHEELVRAAEPINRRIYGGSRPRDDYRLINDVLEVLEGENRARSSRGMMEQMVKDTDEARKICNDEEIAPVFGRPRATHRRDPGIHAGLRTACRRHRTHGGTERQHCHCLGDPPSGRRLPRGT